MAENIIEDRPPEGAKVDKESFDEVMNLAGSPTINPELKQIEEEAGIYTPPPTPVFDTQDKNISLSNENKTATLPSATSPTNQEGAKEVKTDIFDKLLKPDESKPSSEEQPATTTTPQTHGAYTQEQVDELISNIRAEESAKAQRYLDMVNEFEKNPYEFYAKHTPALIEKLNVDEYVNDKLRTEFGDEFQLVQEDIGKYGTLSNKYLRRQSELENEALSLRNTAKETQQQSVEEVNKQLSNLKTSIFTKYGVTDETVIDSIWNEARELTAEQVYDKLIQHALLLKDIDKVKTRIKQPVSRAFQTPSVTDIIGAKRDVDSSAADELRELYGDDRFQLINTIR